MKDILTVTPAARQQMAYLIEKRGKPSAGIKVKVKTGGCSGLAYHIEYADAIDKYDEVIKTEDITVVIDPKAVIYLVGTQMDYVKEKMKEGFVFINPNEKGRCGCGESFRV
jgi:iron-sulfur cluster assembly protein